MTVKVFNETFVGVSELKFQRISDKRVLNLPTPANFVVQENKQQRIQRTKSSQGRMVRAGSYIVGEEPVLNVSYSFLQPEIIAFRLGNQFEESTFDISIARTIEVIKEDYDPAETGDLGFGMPANQVDTEASMREGGKLSEALTKQDFATFDPNTAKSYAQGENGALKFSADLVAAREVVSMVMPHTITGLALGDELVGPHRLVAHMTNTNNEIWVFMADNVTPNIDGAGFDASAESIDIPFFLNNSPGACRAWNLYFTGQRVKCNY